MTKIR